MGELAIGKQSIVRNVPSPGGNRTRRQCGVQPRAGVGQRYLCAPALSDVPREAASMDKTAIVPHDAGIDQNILDRSVLAPQPRGILGQLFSRRQPIEDVADHVPISMKFGDGTTQVFFPGVAKHV